MDERDRVRYRSRRLQQKPGREPRMEEHVSQTDKQRSEEKKQSGEEQHSGPKQLLVEEQRSGERRASARKPAPQKRRPKDGRRSYSRERIPNRSSHTSARRRNRKRKKQTISPLLYLAAGIFAVIICIAILVSLFMPKDSSHESAAARKFEFPWSKSSESKGVIMLDAGHGGKDQGTSYEDVLEKDLNLEITKKVKSLLEDADYQVLLTRSKDTLMDKHERADYANNKKPDVLVSIHCNFLESGQADGIETYYDPDKQEGSQPLADKIQAHIIEKTGATDRGSRADNFVVITDTTMPAALVEAGFLSDAAERALLQDEAYQKKLADGIASGIIEYMEAQSEDEQEAGEE